MHSPNETSVDQIAEPTTAPPVAEEPADTQASTDEKVEPKKRNSGHTGPTSQTGRAIAARNATRHGMCAKTLIVGNESEEDWTELLAVWCHDYGNPAENSNLYTFVVKVAQAEWFRLRVQREYDLFYAMQENRAIYRWGDAARKDHDLLLRYKTTAERTFQREYRQLESHYKTHPAPPPPKAEEQPTQEGPKPRVDPPLFFVNAETGEKIDTDGNRYPAPPDWVPIEITPGKYPPNHPANWSPPSEK